MSAGCWLLGVGYLSVCDWLKRTGNGKSKSNGKNKSRFLRYAAE